MKPLIIQLRTRVPEELIKARVGARVVDDDIGIELRGDCDVYAASGALVCKLRRGAIGQETSDRAYPHLAHLASRYGSVNRGLYSGLPRVAKIGSKVGMTVNPDGSRATIKSSIGGYFEPQGGRFPYCRTTMFTSAEPGRWNEVLPLIREVGEHFARELPDRCKVQRDYAEKCSPYFRIVGTPFSTITVNQNIAGTIHQDKGDLKQGFGIITCHRRGAYTGGLLTFPQYRIAVDLRDRDLIYFDPHEWHGVTEMQSADPDYSRVTVVYYFRAGMTKCGTPEEEVAKAKLRAAGASVE